MDGQTDRGGVLNHPRSSGKSDQDGSILHPDPPPSAYTSVVPIVASAALRFHNDDDDIQQHSKRFRTEQFAISCRIYNICSVFIVSAKKFFIRFTLSSEKCLPSPVPTPKEREMGRYVRDGGRGDGKCLSEQKAAIRVQPADWQWVSAILRDGRLQCHLATTP